MNQNNTLLCLDLGNTTCRGGIWSEGKITDERVIATKEFCSAPKNWIEGWDNFHEVCFCSVVPAAEGALRSISFANIEKEPFCLEAVNQSILPIQYPNPNEIGSDRISNSYAVFKKYPLTAVVIDLGTATTFDVISEKGGYLGGVIVPGPQGMLDYLENRTALLPKLELKTKDRNVPAIGQSSILAMMSGLCHGYLPMLNGILQKISQEIRNSGEIVRSVIQTGGEARNFLVNGAIVDDSLTLEGLALASIDQQNTNKYL